MKRTNRFLYPVIITLSLCLYTAYAHADRILYTYDASGNRVLSQKEILIRGGSSDPQDTVRNTMREQIGGHQISIYPNPTDGRFSVEISRIETVENASITIYGMTGGIVYQTDEAEARNDIDLTSCPDGMYLMVIRVDGAASTWKVIKR